MKDKETPLMRQYNQIKAKHPDTVLLFRLGDFFETFGDDAVTTATACGITLTKRNNGAGGDMPLAGFPHHQLDNYLPKLIKAGYRVAVCEQLEDPKLARGIVKRDVVEVVTPGVVMYDKLLDNKQNTFLMVLNIGEQTGIAITDVSTGTFYAGTVDQRSVMSVIESYHPAEIVVCKQRKQEWEPLINKLPFQCAVTKQEEWYFDVEFAKTTLERHFKSTSLKGFGFEGDFDEGLVAAGVALHYIGETQRGSLQQITTMRKLNAESSMILDAATRRNLEIHMSMHDGKQNGALVGIIDKTSSPMGGRLFRLWLQAPLVSADAINRRLAAVRGLVNEPVKLNALRDVLTKVGDVERLLSRVVTDRANPRDLSALNSGLQCFAELKATLSRVASEDVSLISNSIADHSNVVGILSSALAEDPPIQYGTGRIFKEGYHSELDQIRRALFEGKQWISDYQEEERIASGIPNLKVGFTSVFGYYIEVSKAATVKAPSHFERKQTLTNAERYTTPRLKELENLLLSAEQRVSSIESDLISDLRKGVSAHCSEIQKTALIVAQVDCLCSFATAAIEFEYVEPEVHDGTALLLEGARHPVIERLLPSGVAYVPNTVQLNGEQEQLAIITGPNMSGKSSYLRQTGLIVFLAHIGSFVPAVSAKIPLTDRIFTRVGAQDNITAGESTFLVEMQESANILNNATKRSLILLDEVGRGTATFDGISIAWAIAEYIHEVVGAKTLFATHYHELTSLADTFNRIINLCVEVREVGSDIVFTHRVVPGFTDHSFGIHVAKMAGMPSAVINTSTQILEHLESANHDPSGSGRSPSVERHTLQKSGQLTMFTVVDDELKQTVRDLDVENMTPMQALKALADIKERFQA